MTQLLQLRRLVRSRLGVPATDQLFTDDQVDDNINMAVATVEAEQRWPWQEHVEPVTVDNVQPDIILPATWRATRGLFTDPGTELSLVSPSDALAVTGTGQPSVWAPIGGRIVLRPLPAGSLTLTHYFYTGPAWLSNDTDEPELPDQFAGAIVAKAAELLSTREDDRSAAAAHNLEYNEWITRMRRDSRRSTTPTLIRVRSGGWV